MAHDAHYHVPGNGFGCRQDRTGRRPVSAVCQSRHGGSSVQAAEHVEQCGRRRRWRRNRSGAMAAGSGLPDAAFRPYEPGAAETAKRPWQPDRRAGQGPWRSEGARLPEAQARIAWECSRQLRGTARTGRYRSCGGGRFAGRDQSTGRRYCKYGFCNGRECPGRARRRYRPGRGDRLAGRNACYPDGAGPGDDPRFPDQQIPRRRDPVR